MNIEANEQPMMAGPGGDLEGDKLLADLVRDIMAGLPDEQFLKFMEIKKSKRMQFTPEEVARLTKLGSGLIDSPDTIGK